MIPKNVPTIAEVFKRNLAFTGEPGLCPHCGTAATFAPVASADANNARIDLKRDRGKVKTQIAVCHACSCLLFGAADRDTGSSGRFAMWPNETWPDRAPIDLEHDIRKAYDEARAVFGLSPTASAVLARRCLQHVIRERLQIRENTLFQQIEKAVKREELSKPTKDALHHVREIGNWAAHPSVDYGSADQASTIIEVTREEAEYTIESVEMLFDDLYVAAKRAEKMHARIAKTKPTTPTSAQ